MSFGAAERALIRRCLAIAYEHGGDLDEDDRLIAYAYCILDAAGSGERPALVVLDGIRAEVKASLR